MKRSPAIAFILVTVLLDIMGIGLLIPVLPSIVGQLTASRDAQTYWFGALMLAFGGAQFLCAPLLGALSDRYGRRPVLLTGMALYLAASLACALAHNAEQLIALRVLQAIGGGAGSVMGRTVVRDVFPLDKAAHVLSLMQLVTMIAPLLAPVLGGWLLLAAGWRALFVALALFGANCLAVVALRLPETHPPARRANVSLGSAFRSYGHLLTDVPTVGYLLALGLTFGAMFAYITGSPLVFITLYGVSPQDYGLLFGLNALGLMAASQINVHLLRRFEGRRILGTALAANVVAALVLAAIATLGTSHLLAILVPLFLTISSLGFVTANAMAAAMSRAGARAGIASALIGVLQFTLGAVVGGQVSAVDDGTTAPMGFTIAGLGLAGAGAHRLVRLGAPQAS
jgi:DHA1 family bicyclomycin/chloramphenicol resistance-like MFS transporter